MEDFRTGQGQGHQGSERKSLILSEKERCNTAYHEAGPTLVARLIPGTDPIHKVTIIPRGRALGLTQQLPLEKGIPIPKNTWSQPLPSSWGAGRGRDGVPAYTTGAGNDLERATDLSRKMVCNWGMSDELDRLPSANGKHIFLGREFAQAKDFSEETARVIDSAIKNLVMSAYQRAMDLLASHRAELQALAQTLLAKETLDGAEIDKILASLRTQHRYGAPGLRRLTCP